MAGGRSVLITGASRGIGRATALYLAAAGLHVFAGVRKAEDGARIEAEGGGRIRHVLLDVTDDDSIARAHGRVEREVGPAGLIGLVNNAAAGFGGPLEHVTRADLEQVFEVNFHGVVLTTQAFLPLLKRAKGRIVNVGGGGAGCLAIPLMGVGCASKYAIEGMTDALRVELRKLGVRVSLVEPGMTYSEADKPIFRASMNADFDRVLARVPSEQKSHYGPALERLRAFNSSFLDRAAPPETVARRIHHALTARRPRSRYWCGRETVLAAALGRFAPAKARDAIWGRITGL
jgi:NAD(P)-dependent dehydrogenase (short-subunit alcohol dehydrogenase family)